MATRARAALEPAGLTLTLNDHARRLLRAEIDEMLEIGYHDGNHQHLEDLLPGADVEHWIAFAIDPSDSDELRWEDGRLTGGTTAWRRLAQALDQDVPNFVVIEWRTP